MPVHGLKRKADMEDNRRQQSNFYLKLSPIEGHEIAQDEGNFILPSEESMEHELRDVLRLWLTLQQTSAGEIIANSAWWMTQYMDPERRLTATEGMVHLDKLTSFAVSVVGQLIDEGILEFAVHPDIPDIRLSREHKFDISQMDFLNNIERLLEEIEEDE